VGVSFWIIILNHLELSIQLKREQKRKGMETEKKNIEVNYLSLPILGLSPHRLQLNVILLPKLIKRKIILVGDLPTAGSRARGSGVWY